MKVDGAADVVEGDLDAIVAGLTDELPELAGKRLLLSGGAGFLGYVTP